MSIAGDGRNFGNMGGALLVGATSGSNFVKRSWDAVDLIVASVAEGVASGTMRTLERSVRREDDG
ncbi:MAG TPA: hypothetical protein DCY79_11560 [Planctomycetaceae bacterium]|nr:hypothetical protein [Planctomycetaceae bacterium]